MNAIVELMNVSAEPAAPSQTEFELWSDAVLQELNQVKQNFEIGIRLVSEEESAELNHNFRNKQGPTNVLSFTYTDIPAEAKHNLLGDLAICSKVVIREAQEQQKAVLAHWAHMTIHGMLHLLGYDHRNDTEAVDMEELESNILSKLGYPHPYKEQQEHRNS